jgi:hypothetical protein
MTRTVLLLISWLILSLSEMGVTPFFYCGFRIFGLRIGTPNASLGESFQCTIRFRNIPLM